MRRELYAWGAALAVIIALWFAFGLAFWATLPPPDEPAVLGPLWFYLGLLFNVPVTFLFALAMVIRAIVLAVVAIRAVYKRLVT